MRNGPKGWSLLAGEPVPQTIARKSAPALGA